MRGIKFRAWNSKTAKMVGISQKNLWRSTLIPADNEVLMQYTGLKDKNGVDIYEGDILKFAYTDGQAPPIVEVYWDKKYCSFWFRGRQLRGWAKVSSMGRIDWVELNTSEDEVIGNIYENKELLK